MVNINGHCHKENRPEDDDTVLVAGAINILKNMSLSMGRMTSHI